MRPLLLLSLSSACACAIQHGTPPKTTADLTFGEISLDQSVQSYEDGKIALYATPYTTSASLLTLDASDTFEAEVTGTSTAALVLAGSHYTATVTTAAAAPLEVTISLVRTNPSARATSKVTLPAPPHIVSASPALAQGQDLVIDLDAPPPPGVRVTLRFLDAVALLGDATPTCLDVPSAPMTPTSVTGTRIVVAGATLFARDPARKTAPAASCDIKVGVRFETAGARDGALGGGGISGLVERPAYGTGSAHVTRAAL